MRGGSCSAVLTQKNLASSCDISKNTSQVDEMQLDGCGMHGTATVDWPRFGALQTNGRMRLHQMVHR